MKKITLLALCAFWFPVQAQNNCNSALTAVAGINQAGMITGTQLPTPDCSGDDPFINAATWYKFTATQTGFVTISSHLPQSQAVDTRLHVFSGVCGELTCVGFNDDVSINMPGSQVTFPAIAGTTYYFVWDDYWTDEAFAFTIAQNIVNCPSELPYVEDFSDSGIFEACYARVDGDGSGLSFALGDGPDLTGDGIEDNVVLNILNPGGAKNDWLFSPEFLFEQGATYEIIAFFNVFDTDGEDIRFVIADQPSSGASFMQEIGSFPQTVEVGETEQELYDQAYAPVMQFVAPATGNYRFGMNVTTPAPNGFAVLFGYSITQIMNTDSWSTAAVKLFPNPTSGMLNLSASQNIDEVSVYNLLGQQIFTKATSSETVAIDVSALSAGTYLVRVRSGQLWSNAKFVKQ